MFTGLIQATGKVVARTAEGGGARLAVDVSGLAARPAVGASVALAGACQTVTGYDGGAALFFAMAETLARTTLGSLAVGARVNLEAALRAGDPLDGHLVQGHVDATAKLLSVAPSGAARTYTFALPRELAPLVAEKGSVAVDGISLTATRADLSSFSVSVIPHTLEHTTLPDLRPGDRVNLEADVLARYAARILSARAAGGVTETRLRDHGFAR